MKNKLITTLILLALLVSFAFCCGNTGTRTPVPPKHEIEYSVFEDDSVSEYRKFYIINYDKSGNISGYEELTYNEDGSLKEHKIIDKYGNTKERIVYDYKNHLPTKITKYDGKNRNVEHSESKYNANRNRTEYREYEKEKLKSYKLYEYDENGRRTSIKTYDANGNLIEYTESGYDKSGRPSLKSTYDADGNLKNKKETIYNGKGKISENKTTDADGNVTESVKYEYSRGRVSKKIENIDGKKKITTYEYNGMGQVTKYTIVDGNGKFIESKVSEFTDNGYLKNEFYVDKNGKKLDGTVYLYEGVK